MTRVITTTLRCGPSLHVLVASTRKELAALADRERMKLARPNGHAVVDASGTSVFIVDEVLHPLQWHKDGNRVQANRVRREIAADGTVSNVVLRKVWVTL